MLAALVTFLSAFDSEAGLWIGYFVFFLSYWLAILIHEFGHAAAAVACGWRVVIFAVGPIGYNFHNREFAFIPRSKREELAGFVFSIPKEPRVWTRLRKALFIAAGPLASVCTAAMAFVVAISARAVDAGSFNASLMVAGFGLISMATAFNTLTPSARAARKSDIQQLIHTLRTSELTWQQERAVGWLYALAKHKVRLRELPEWMLKEAQQVAKQDNEGYRFAVDALSVGIVLDSPPVDLTKARALLNQFRAAHGQSPWLDSCDAYFTAIWEADAERASAKLWRGQVEEDLRPLALAAEAAVFARQGDKAAARSLLSQMREAVRKSPFTDHTFRDIGRQIEALL
jgi:hypothetical protein